MSATRTSDERVLESVRAACAHVESFLERTQHLVRSPEPPKRPMLKLLRGGNDDRAPDA
jgi:hypothetical protein